MSRGSLAVFAILLAAVVIATVLLIARVDINTGKIATLERQHHQQDLALIAGVQRSEMEHTQNLQLIRDTDYRLCLRQQIVGATLNLNAIAAHKDHLLPLYDCKPDLTTGVAIRLTFAQTKAFEHYVATAKNLP